ncbi:MAG: putative endonuclease 4 [Candidatus Tectimicrobiota bacterium]|nr:MAG: putative endonuclease 4 [Candidatus Tectomicrobia bacterium]
MSAAPLLGAHMPTSGGLPQALYRGQQVGCEVVQVFTRPSRQWQAPPLTQAALAAWQEARRATGIATVVAHAPYLVNLASADAALWQRSLRATIEDLERCEALGIDLLILHPGAHGGEGEAAGLRRVARALDAIHAACPGFRVRLALEITAGQGTSLGCRFAHLRRLLELVRESERLRVCFDTQHAFAAGYELRTPAGYEHAFATFDALVGLERLAAFHLNDAPQGRGSRVDRHAHIGKGQLGVAFFHRLLHDRRFWGLPMCLETPKGKDLQEDREALTLLRSLLDAAPPAPAESPAPDRQRCKA